MPLNAYDRGMLKKASYGDKNEFYNIIIYCLELLQINQLLTSETYFLFYLPFVQLSSLGLWRRNNAMYIFFYSIQCSVYVIISNQ